MLEANTDRMINAIGMVMIAAIFIVGGLAFFGKDSDSLFTQMVGGAEGHVVDYDLDSGKGDFSRVVVDYENNDYQVPNKEPSRDSYIFNGWLNSLDSQTYYPGSTMTVDGDTVLKAQWKPSTHDVQYDLNGGIGNIKNVKVAFNESFRLSDIIPTKEGHHLDGWESSADGVVYDPHSVVEIGGPTTFKAVWKLNTYEVRFNFSGGASTGSFETVNVEHNKTFSIPATLPTRTGYVFHGWKHSGTDETLDEGTNFKVTQNTELVAQWGSNSYRLRYSLNGGAYPSDAPNLTHYGGYGEIHRTISTVPTRAGHRFVGWKNGRTGNVVAPGSGFAVQGDTELVAEWAIIDFNVTFNLDGGTGSFPTQPKSHNATLKIPTDIPVKYGYRFNGWLNDSDNKIYKANETFAVQDDIELKALWLNDNFEIIYELDGGVGSIVNNFAQYLSEYTISQVEPSRTGASFKGWLNSQDGKIYDTASKITIEGRTTLTAQWNVNDYTVKYDVNGGTGAFLAVGLSHGTNHSVYSHLPTRTGYDFVGWKAGQTTYDAGSKIKVTSNLNLVAQWEKKKLTITYQLNGGKGSFAVENGLFSDKYTVNATPPTRDGYTFNGWLDTRTNKRFDPNDTFILEVNTQLQAQWDVNAYNVMYDLNLGTGSAVFDSPHPVFYGRSHKITNDVPKRIGHIFTGWLNSTNDQIYKSGDSIVINEATDLVAQWTVGEYTVKFDLNGGTVNDTSVYEPVTNKSGYIFEISPQVPKNIANPRIQFMGWRDESGINIIYEPGEAYAIAEGTTLKALWDYAEYQIVYDENGGKMTYPEDNIHGNIYTASTLDGHTVIHGPTATNNAYEFAGWRNDADNKLYQEGDNVVPLTNITLTAEYKLKEYTLKFNNNSGTGVTNTYTMQHGVPIKIENPTPTRVGYIFDGWSTNLNGSGTRYRHLDNITATSNTTLYAQWAPEKIGMYYRNTDGIENMTLFKDTIVDFGATFKFPTDKPVRYGYTFIGWSLRDNGLGTSYQPGASMVLHQNNVDLNNNSVSLYPTWDANIYLITYDLNGGEGTTREHSAPYGSIHEASTTIPTRVGYTFTGWTRPNGTLVKAGATFTITKDEVLKATWVPINYNISFNLDGGSGTFNTVSAAYDSSYKTPTTSPTKAGYAFTGWTRPNGTLVKAGDSFTVKQAEVLKATWLANSYNITFDLNGGSGTFNAVSATHDSTYKTPTTIPTRTGYTFTGWTRPNGTLVVAGGTFKVSQAEVLKATWKANNFNITFNLNGGTGTFNTVSAAYDSTYNTPATTPTRVGYTFTGWTRPNGSLVTAGQGFKVTQAEQLKATWKANNFNISFNLDGGSGTFNTVSAAYDSTYKTPATIPTKAGHAFTGWTRPDGTLVKAGDSFTVKQAEVLKATWTTNSYNITFDLNGGTGTFNAVSAAYGSSYKTPTTIPTKAGHTFTGWTRPNGTLVKAGDSFTVTQAEVVKATWTVNNYNITFNLNGGTGTFNTVSAAYGLAYKTPTTIPTKVGHTFTGWTRPNGTLVTAGQGFTVAQAEQLTATWKANDFNISFNLDGGSGTFNTVSATYDSTYKTPTTIPTKVGHTFTGWTRPNGTLVKAGDSFTVKQAEVLKATWTTNSYNITFNLNGGTGTFNTVSAAYGLAYKTPTTKPTRTGYTFTGWTRPNGSLVTAGQGFTVAQAEQLTATWKANDFNISFNLDGGSGTFNTVSAAYDSTYKTPTTIPTKVGHTFTGWTRPNGTLVVAGGTFKVSQAEVLKATWKANNFNVSFNLNNGSGSFSTVSVPYGTSYKTPTTIPTRTNYTFVGWTRADRTIVKAGESFIVEKAEQLIATWELNTYNITFNLDGGAGTFNPASVTHGSVYTTPTTIPTKTGYTFAGWSRPNGNIVQAGGTMVISQAEQLKATWTLNNYLISFDLNGGSGVFNTVGAAHGLAYKTPTTKPTRVGYTFTGWTRPNGSLVTAGQGFTVDKAEKLTATWTVNYYDISFDLNGGSGTFNTVSNAYGSTFRISATIPTRTGYTFGGWSRPNGTTVPAGQTITVTQAEKLTAIWTVKRYDVIFDLNGGSGSFAVEAYTYGTLYNTPTKEPTRTGYTFMGWTRSNGDLVLPGKSFTVLQTELLTAKWAVNYYDISFNVNGGSGTFNTVSNAYGSSFKLSTTIPVRTGYTFDGWSRPDGTTVQAGQTITVTQAEKLTAKWTVRSYEILFNLRGGRGTFVTESRSYNTLYYTPTNEPTRTGYTFMGWTRSNGAVVLPGKSFTVLQTETLDAKWAANYNVSYDLSFGYGSFPTQTAVQGVSFKLPTVLPSRYNSTFMGWKRANGTTVQAGQNITVAANETLTAVWKDLSPTVRYNGNGGTRSRYGYDLQIPGPQKVNAGTSYTNYDVPNMEKSGYTFVGWRNSVTGVMFKPTSTSAGDVSIYFTMPNQSVTMEAIFTKN